MNPEEKHILALTCFGHFLSHFNVLVFPALVLPLAARWDMSLAAVLAHSFWLYLLFGVTALPWGFAADKLGPKPFLLLYFLGAGGSSLAAAWWLDSPLMFSIALGGVGLFSGIYHPIGLGMISKSINRVSLAMGYNGVFGNLGLASAPLLAGLLNWLAGPQAAFAGCGLLNLLGLALVARAKIPEDLHTDREKSATGQARWSPFIILLAAMMMGGIAYRAATVITPAMLELKSAVIVAWLTKLVPGGIPANMVATGLMSLIYAVGALGQYYGGRTADRFGPRWVYLGFNLISIPLAVAAAWLTDLPLTLVVMVYFMLLLGMQPSENTLVSRLTPPSFQHSAFGAKFTLTFGVGAVSVYLAGVIEQTWSMGSVYLFVSSITAIWVLLTAALIVRLRKLNLDVG